MICDTAAGRITFQIAVDGNTFPLSSRFVDSAPIGSIAAGCAMAAAAVPAMGTAVSTAVLGTTSRGG